MAQRVAGLYIDLGLNSQGFESGLREAGRSLKKFGADAGGGGRDVTRVFADMSSAMRAGMAMAAGLAGGVTAIGATTVIARLRETAAAVADIGAQAKMAGVSAERFQELGYAAQQVKVGTDALADGLKELQIRADEFILTGAGGGAEAFERLGYTAEQLKEKLKKPDLLFEEIIEKLKRLDTAAQIRILDEVFGGSGEQYMRFLDASRETIGDMSYRARALGIVMDDELVARAEELNAKFEQLSIVLEMRLKGAILSVADEFMEFSAKVESFFTWLGGGDVKRGLSIFSRAAGVISSSNPFARAAIGAASNFAQGQIPTQDELRAEGLRKLARQMNEGRTSTAGDLTAEGWVTRQDEADARKQAATLKEKPKKESRASTRLTPGQEFDRSLDSIKEQIAALEMEQRALDMTAYEAERLRVEHQLLAEARRMGVEITPEIEARIKSEAAAYAAAVDKLEQARGKAEDIRALQDMLGQSLASSMSGLIDGTKTLNDVVSDLVGNLADAAIQAALLGQGPLASLLGGGTSGGLMGALFSGISSGFSEGGYTGNGGKHDPAGVVHRGEYVFDKAATSRIGVRNLEAIRRGVLPGYASGGPVGAAMPALRMPVIPQLSAPSAASRSLRLLAS